MPYLSVYIHCIWSTKYRNPFLHTYQIRKRVWSHIKNNAAANGIFVDHVNGYKDHCHCLISLNSNQDIEQVMKFIKGETSRWINENNILEELPEGFEGYNFKWQDEYYVVSVSKSLLTNVRGYIRNQERHHHKKSFEDEIERLEKYHGFIIVIEEEMPPTKVGGN